MNMKKVLAVVLAVIMAVSAMAITVFAEDVKIPLHRSLSVARQDVTITLTIPVYGTYGYFTEGDYFVLDLPTAAELGGAFTNYKVKVNGFESKANADGVHVVYFGHVARDYINDTYPTVIPVDTTINGTSNITVVLTGNVPNAWEAPSADSVKNGAYSVQFYDAVDGEVVGSYSTAKFWNPTASVVDTSYNNTLEFVNTVTYRDVVTGGGSIWGGGDGDFSSLKNAQVWTWDHTIGNKNAIYGADTVQLVVELTKPLNGRATYVLWANKEAKDIYETQGNWWNYSANRIQVATTMIDGKVDKLVFDVPVAALYDYNYGVWNNQLAITEEITLRDMVLGQDPTKNNYLVDVADGYYNTGVFGDGSFGDLTWAQYGGGAKYKGSEIIYALGGEAYAQNNIMPWEARYGAGAKEIYLLASTAEVENDVIVEVEDPVESTTEEEEDVTVEVEEPAEDTNPGTGLALAVVPMLVAAAAVVASKRR